MFSKQCRWKFKCSWILRYVDRWLLSNQKSYRLLHTTAK